MLPDLRCQKRDVPWITTWIFAFSPLHFIEPLRKQKAVVCDLLLVDFDPFCVFLCFKVRCLFFEKHRKFYLSSKFFFNFFTLKRGKFRFQRWNCSYRASISRGNTDTEGWKRTGSFPLTITYADKRSGCHSNGLIDVAEKFEHAQYELSRMSTEVPSSSWLIEEDRRRLCSQGTPTNSNLSKTNLNRMQRPGETQEEHSFELMTNVDGAHVYMNAGSEGSASENPKPVLMRTTTGKNDNENASKERPRARCWWGYL